MKKVFLIIALLILLCHTQNFGQSVYRRGYQKKSITLGLNSAWGFGATEPTFTLISRIGFFPVNGLALGLAVDFCSNEYSSHNVKDSEFTFGPAMRVYSPDGFFLHWDVTFGKTKVNGFDGNAYGNAAYVYHEADVNIRKIQLGLGYSFLIKNSIDFELSIMYRNYQRTTDSSIEVYYNAPEFVASAGFSFFLKK